jgi:hypothetical protein
MPRTTLCVMVARDCLHDTEAGSQTATLGGLTASRSRVVARPSVPPTPAMVETIVVVPSPAHANLYALLQCSEDSKYERKTYGNYIEVFQALMVEDSESSPPASGNF